MGGYERSQVDSCLHGCSKDAPARWIRVRGPALMMAALVPLGGCSSAASRPAKGPITVATGSRSHAPTTTASLFKRAGVPQTYQQACMQEGGCAAAGPVPAKLVRPLRFPYTGHGSCRGSPGRYVATPDFGSMALGTGPVRVAINNAGDPRHGFHPAAFSGWLLEPRRRALPSTLAGCPRPSPRGSLYRRARAGAR
jgi:hypothetical protein